MMERQNPNLGKLESAARVVYPPLILRQAQDEQKIFE
mgnify:CR=1 FL=1